MSFEIIIKGKPERHAIVRTRSQVARRSVSRENRQEYDNEKRAKELNRKMPHKPDEYNAAAIAKMMCIPEQQALRMVKRKSKGMVLDGKID